MMQIWPYLLCALFVGLAISYYRHWREWVQTQRDNRSLARSLGESEERYREALFQARAQLQTLFNSMVEGVMLLEQDGRIHLINQSLERQFRLLLDVRGLTVMEALSRPELTSLVEKLRDTRQVLTLEIDVNGSVQRCLEVNAASILDREGKPQGAMLVFHDLTRIRQLENNRREFVANVSHELRTPLSLIKGYAETLLSGAKDQPETATRFLQKIERHSNRLTSLIEDLLTISQLESGRVLLKLEKVDLHEFAARMLDDLQGRASGKQTKLENLVPRGLCAQVDHERLHQVLFNLLDNAIKYGHIGGTVTIDGRAVSEERVQISVGDDGPGIPPEAKGRLFERFYRVDKARSRDTGGTGLGLSIVKHIVQSHGGEVWVESQPGHGATFCFTIPKG